LEYLKERETLLLYLFPIQSAGVSRRSIIFNVSRFIPFLSGPN